MISQKLMDPNNLLEMLHQFLEKSELVEQAAILKLKNGRAPGEDNLPAELYRHGGGKLLRVLHKLFTGTWEAETVTNDFEDAKVVNIYKRKGDIRIHQLSRNSLLYAASKILARIMKDRLIPVFEILLPKLRIQTQQRYNRYDFHSTPALGENSRTALISASSDHLPLESVRNGRPRDPLVNSSENCAGGNWKK